MKWKYIESKEHKFNISVIDELEFRGIKYCGWIKGWIDYNSINLNPIDTQFRITVSLVAYQLDLADEPYTELDTKMLSDQENFELDKLCSALLEDEVNANIRNMLEGS